MMETVQVSECSLISVPEILINTKERKKCKKKLKKNVKVVDRGGECNKEKWGKHLKPNKK